MKNSALILFAHGARDPAWANPMQRLRLMIQQQSPQSRVELAFLEFMDPNLANCAENLIRHGMTQLHILPLFIATGGHLKKDLPELVHTLEQRHPAVRISLARAVGEDEAVLAAMANHALELFHGR